MASKQFPNSRLKPVPRVAHAGLSPQPVSRRRVLGTLGSAGLSAGLLPFLPHAARAQAVAPKRLLFYFHSMGFLEEYFWPKPAETDPVQPGNSTKTFTLGESLQPLQAFKDKLILLDGINCFGVGVSNTKYRICDNAHGKGIKMVFTGSKVLANTGLEPTNSSDMECTNDLASGWQPAGGPSLDQVIADHIGQDSLFKSVTLGAFCGTGTHRNAFWAGANQPITPEESPTAAFDHLFGNLANNAQQAARLESLRVRRQSVIDTVRDDLNRLQARLGASQKQKIDSHLTALRELEGRLAVRQINCQVPTKSGISTAGSKIGQPAQDAIRAQMDVIVGAFRCDLTRVAGLQLGHADDGPIAAGLPLERHPAAHSVNSTNPDQQNAINTYKTTDAWYASHLGYLLQQMSAIPEDGGTMLDNTLIVFGTDTQGWLREGGVAHMATRFPMMMMGGGNFAFQTGRYIKTNPYNIAGSASGDETLPSHHRVLVSIAQKFGMDINSFGTLDPAALGNHIGGPLPGL